jgi:hypothetical protein
MADEDWPDNPQTPLDDATREQYQSTVTGPVPANPTYYAGGMGFRRAASLIGTGAAGVPGDIIQSVNTGIDTLREVPIFNSLMPRVPNIGPQIPIPTTEYLRNQFGVAPPAQGEAGRSEREMDLLGKTIGSGVTALALPGTRGWGMAGRGGNMLSAMIGAGTSGLAEEHFPDSWALQLLAGGAAGLSSTALARQLLGGGIRTFAQNAGGMTNALMRDYIGRAVGAGVAHMTGLPELLTTELGGMAGLMSHRMGRALAGTVLSPFGLKKSVAGFMGAIPEALQTYQGNQEWPDNPQIPLTAPQ